MTKNKCLLKNVEKVIREMSGNDDETLSKLLSAFVSTDRSKEPTLHHLEVEKSREHQNGSSAIILKNQEHETVETLKSMFQNHAVEKYLNESMRKALKKYKNYG